MTRVQEMIRTNPSAATVDAGTLAECIEACLECAQTCSACADVCGTTGGILSRQTAFEPEMAQAALHACSQACKLCGDECERHASDHEHCQVCAEACRRCQSACDDVLSAMAR